MEVESITYDETRDVLDIVFVHESPAVRVRDGQRGATVELDAEDNFVAMHVPEVSKVLGAPANWLTPHVVVKR